MGSENEEACLGQLLLGKLLLRNEATGCEISER